MLTGDLNYFGPNVFRLLPIHVEDRCILGFTWPSENGSLQYFMDCCLPTDLSASCHSFERFSSALQWIMTEKYGASMSHLLDDFLSVQPIQLNAQLTYRHPFLFVETLVLF